MNPYEKVKVKPWEPSQGFSIYGEDQIVIPGPGVGATIDKKLDPKIPEDNEEWIYAGRYYGWTTKEKFNELFPNYVTP